LIQRYLCFTYFPYYLQFGGEYYDGSENLVFDELLRWNHDAKTDNNEEEDRNSDNNDNNNINNSKEDSYDTGKWTRILSPAPIPPPRCAHSAVFHNDGIYIFGGEMATNEKYHHYKDLWRFDVKKNFFEECKSRGGSPPAARSGHRAVVWRHYMIIFGGFQEELRAETRWFNDVHIFDFQTNIWCELKYNKLARLPPARSACNMTVCADALFIYGGYSKLKNANAPGANKSEGITHIDCWVLSLKPLLNSSKSGCLSGASPPSWERITRKGEYPSQRAGTSAILHKNKLLVFGGVLDSEGDQHKIESVFYDDLFALDMERRRWFAMRLKKASGGGRRRKKKDNQDDTKVENDGGDDTDNSEEEDEGLEEDAEAVSSGWDLDKLRHDMFAFIDGNGNIVYEKIEHEDGDNDPKTAGEEEKPHEGSNPSIDVNVTVSETANTEETNQGDLKSVEKIDASSVMQVDSKGLPSTVTRQTPLPRINCAVAIKGNTLFIYGGVVEVGDREVTLDDCWSIDLNKREKWTCIWPGQMHKQVWKGVDDDDSYISSDQGGDDDDDENSLDEDFELDPIHEDENNDEKISEEERKKAKKAAKKAKDKEKRRGVRHEILELKEKLGVDNAQRTPQMGESVAEFYARTTEYWSAEAAKSAGAAAADSGERLSTKELAREGFLLAKERYEELKPVLERLDELENMQQEGAEEKQKKKEKKSSKKERR
jgi:hypothetical protein